jgi:hypothetical protein
LQVALLQEPQLELEWESDLLLPPPIPKRENCFSTFPLLQDGHFTFLEGLLTRSSNSSWHSLQVYS